MHSWDWHFVPLVDASLYALAWNSNCRGISRIEPCIPSRETDVIGHYKREIDIPWKNTKVTLLSL